MTEKQIEKKLGEEIKKLGGLYYKFISPGNIGVPDRIVVFRGKVWFVELKTEIGKLSAAQRRQTHKLFAAGAGVRVLFGKIDVNGFLEEVRDA